MIKIKTLEIAGFASAVQALRLPFGKECRSEVFSKYYADGQREPREVFYQSSTFVHQKDLHLMSVLAKRGDEHAKVLRGVMVYAEIDAPRYWWQEMDTYRIGTDRLSSESTMHIQGRGMSEEELVKMKSELTEVQCRRECKYSLINASVEYMFRERIIDSLIGESSASGSNLSLSLKN